MSAPLLCNLKCRPQLLHLRSNTLQSQRSIHIRPNTAVNLLRLCRCCSSVAADGQEVADGVEISTPATQDTLWQSNSERYQPILSKVEKNEKRAESQRLGKKLVTLIIGRAGITRNTVYALGDALSKNELVKVKAGSACQTDMQAVHDLLTTVTDSVCVHSVGYTLTLFRDKMQPRPQSSTAELTPAQRVEQEMSLLTAKQVKGIVRKANRKSKEREQRAVVEARPSAYAVVSEPVAVSDSKSSAGPRSISSGYGGSVSRAAPSTREETIDGSARARAARTRGAALILAVCVAAQLVASPLTEAATLLALSTSGQHAVLAATNTAILQGIQRQKAADYGSDGKLMSSGEQRVRQLQKVQEQLRRTVILSSSGEYNTARMELREGAASSLRKDLRSASEDFESIKEQMVADAVSSIEVLDSALKLRQPSGDVQTLAVSAAEKLGVVIEGLQASVAAEIAQN